MNMAQRKRFCYAQGMQKPVFDLIDVADGYLVVAKRAGVPTVPLAGQVETPTLLGAVGASYPEVLEPMGRIPHEGGVLHRLDTDTCGLVLLARNREFYDNVSKSQRSGSFIKQYIAAVHEQPAGTGYPPFTGKYSFDGDLLISSRFRPYGPGRRMVRPVTEDSSVLVRSKSGSKLYETVVHQGGANAERERLVRCTISEGFRHQIRCHLAWAGTPIVGDPLYGTTGALKLAAIAIQFPSPCDNRVVSIRWDHPPAWTTPT